MEELPQQILTTYDLPVGLIVDTGCLGAVGPITLGEVIGRVILPSVGGGVDGEDEPDNPPMIAAPVVPGLHRPGQQLLNELGEDVVEGGPDLTWGGPLNWRTTESRFAIYITRIALCFITSVNQSSDQIIESLYQWVDSWFEMFAAWVPVIVDQDMSPEFFTSLPMPGSRLDIRLVSTGKVATPNRVSSGMRVNFPPSQQPLDKSQWNYVLARASQGHKPPIEYKFATGARTAARLSEFRRAVVDAATSVELSLNRILENSLGGLSEPMRAAVGNERRMLRSLIELLADVDKLPAGLRRKDILRVAKVRNSAMHRGYLPTRDEAFESANLAIRIASDVVPLPEDK